MHVRNVVFSLMQDPVICCRGKKRGENEKTTWDHETEQSLLVVTYMHHLFFRVLLSALWRNIFHFVSCLWHCSLGVTLPLWFRSDLSQGRNVPSQPGMTTEWHIHPPPLKLHKEAACWLSYDETMETNVFHFIMHISGFGILKDRQSPGQDFFYCIL